MANDNTNRVINRMGARELTAEETAKITGSSHINTHASHVPTGTPVSPDVGFDS